MALLNNTGPYMTNLNSDVHNTSCVFIFIYLCITSVYCLLFFSYFLFFLIHKMFILFMWRERPLIKPK